MTFAIKRNPPSLLTFFSAQSIILNVKLKEWLQTTNAFYNFLLHLIYEVWNWKCQVWNWKCQFKKVKVKHIAVWCCRNRQSDQIRENEVFARPFQHITSFLRQQWKCLSTKNSKDAVLGWKVWLTRNWSCLKIVQLCL